MKLDEILLLVKAGYSKDEIMSITETEHEKKPETEHEKKPETEHEKKPETEHEKKPKTEHEKTFDYDKLAETIIEKIQTNNRSANLDKNKNSTDDWLSQLSLKF